MFLQWQYLMHLIKADIQNIWWNILHTLETTITKTHEGSTCSGVIFDPWEKKEHLIKYKGWFTCTEALIFENCQRPVFSLGVSQHMDKMC